MTQTVATPPANPWAARMGSASNLARRRRLPQIVCHLVNWLQTLDSDPKWSRIRSSEGDNPNHSPALPTMTKIIPSSRFAALLGDAERVAQILINRPQVIGGFRAALLLNLAQTNRQGRRALQSCARAANRHHVAGNFNDRVFNKASTQRLAMWAQDRPSAV